MYKSIFSVLMIILSFTASAQVKDTLTGRMETVIIETFEIKAEVIGILQGTSDLAVLKITHAAENEWNVKVGDEVLVKFYFGLKPFQGEVLYPGIHRGDIIKGDMHCETNKNTVQIDYAILRYAVLDKAPTKKP